MWDPDSDPQCDHPTPSNTRDFWKKKIERTHRRRHKITFPPVMHFEHLENIITGRVIVGRGWYLRFRRGAFFVPYCTVQVRPRFVLVIWKTLTSRCECNSDELR